jgi:hypothetical protein
LESSSNQSATNITTGTGTFLEQCQNANYWLQTYASMEEAQAAGGFVTHVGHCGLCSTLQDFSVYLSTIDLTSKGKVCTAQGAFSPQNALNCYRNLGLTDECAKIWAEDSWNTAKQCFKECVLHEGAINRPNNGPAPDCKLNACLQCDETNSGPIFRHYAGRTRRRSGLLSAIARPCDQIIHIAQTPCPTTKPWINATQS